jgi:glycosyltransferase involved in cell wall biosynthesis
VTPELHRRGGTERGNAEVVARMAETADVCLFAHHWEPDGTPVCYHRVPVMPWPGMARFLSFFASASLQVERAQVRHGEFSAVYSPGANCWQVDVSSAWFCQARQLDLFRSGKHRPAPQTPVDWLKLAHRWSYAYAVAQVERVFYDRARLRRVITQSNLLAADLRDFYGVPEDRIAVAHGGVSCETFTPEKRAAQRATARRELGIRDDEFAFFFIGNNWLIKGLYHVMAALPHVPPCRVMVVGLGAERPESWRAFSRQLGVEARVTYLGKRPDVIYYYAAADALLAPSVYDTFPLMPMEAMACGLPTIISRRTGVAEIVGPEDCLVVERLDPPDELAAAMRRMVEDRGLQVRLAANGLALAQRSPWDRIYRAIADELEQATRAHALNGNRQH